MARIVPHRAGWCLQAGTAPSATAHGPVNLLPYGTRVLHAQRHGRASTTWRPWRPPDRRRVWQGAAHRSGQRPIGGLLRWEWCQQRMASRHRPVTCHDPWLRTGQGQGPSPDGTRRARRATGFGNGGPSECEMVAQAPEHHLTRAHDSAKDGVESRRRESTLATRRPTFARSGLATPPGRITSAARLPGRGRPCVIRMYRGRIDGAAAGGGQGERHERAFAEACGARGGPKARRTRLGGEGDNAAAPGAVGRHRALRRDRRPSGRGNTRP